MLYRVRGRARRTIGAALAAMFVFALTSPARATHELVPIDSLIDPATLPNVCDTFTCIFPTLPGLDVSIIEPPDVPAPVFDAAPDQSLIGGGVPVGPEDLGAPSNRTCYFFDTSYARGGRGEGDDAYFGVDTALGARAAAHTISGGSSVTTRHSNAWAAAGVAFTYKGRSNSALVSFPWDALGEMSTQYQQSVAHSSRAEAETDVKVVLRDLTTGTTLGSHNVAHWFQEGEALEQRQASGRRSISFTLQNRHKYAAFIRLDVYAESDTPHPFLAADSRNDFFQGPRRASLDFVKVETFTHPVTCS